MTAEWNDFFGGLTDDQVLGVWARSMRELRSRGIVRSSNNPVADVAEAYAAQLLGLTLAPKVAQGYDATGPEGTRYQIKSRRITPENASRQLGVVRNIAAREFDVLLALLFNESMTPIHAYSIPYEVVVEYGKWVPKLNGHRIHAQGRVIADPRVTAIDIPMP